MAMTTQNMTEHDILVKLITNREVNRPWLESQALRIEEALAECPNILGPSVTANFAEHGFELDLTIEASGTADAYDKLGQVFKVVEEAAGIELGASNPDEVRSAYESPTNADVHSGSLAPEPVC